MTREDIIKVINGDIFYRYDYTDFLYQQLEGKNILISIKSKRIQDLLKRLSKRQDNINRAKKEIERLNNVINELEKWLKEDKEYAMNNFECGRCFNMFDIINKLQELKEGK